MKNITCPPASRLAAELHIDAETAALLRRELKAGYSRPAGEHWSHAAFAWFERCARLADFVNGVESLHPARPGILYFNAGDTYTTTLIFDHAAARVRLGCWGDLVEA
jgi:hypothetical protein